MEEGEERRIDLLRHKEAFVELVRHSYAVQILAATGRVQENFRQCGKLCVEVPVSRLVRPHSLGDLFELAAFIEDDVILSREPAPLLSE
jgi:hypothetical protein